MSHLDRLFGGKHTATVEASKCPQGNAVDSEDGDFAIRLHHRLADKQAGKNLFLSPFSIQVALAMCAIGAKGQTRKVMADLLGAPESADDQNHQYAELLRSVSGEGERPFELVIANALWGEQSVDFNPDFQRAIAEFYDGALHEVDFVNLPDASVKSINDWVSNKTQGKIRELVNRDLIDETTRLILTNAIYFKGLWKNRFRVADTWDEKWHRHHDTTRNVPMMHQSGGFPYFENKDFQALDLPYEGGKLGLLIVLPKEKHGLDSLEAKWASEGMYEKVAAGLHHEPVIVSIPRFKMEAEFSLKAVLSDIGAEIAFTDEADFGGISDVQETSLKISDVVHKAFVEVNEVGTEAAAATVIVAVPRCASPIQPFHPKVFKADHPFLFVIRDRTTDTVLFSGHLLDPL